MHQSKRLSFLPLLVLLTMFFSGDVSAQGAINQSASVFKFQQTLANKGNGFAQYKLGTMYESGIGVDKDIEQAKQWYQQASAKGVKAASDRSIFLTVKDEGFIKAQHQSWVDGIQADAKKRDTESMLLLGQLYYKGIGVKKNLDKSLALLTYVNSSGGANVEREIELIQNEMDANKMAAYKSTKTRSTKARSPKVKTKKQVTVQVNKQTIKQAKVKSKAELAREKAFAKKRLRYEKVMAQIELEQQKINEQQARVTGGEVVAIDDEF